MCVCEFAVASQRRTGLPPTTSAGSIRRRHGPEANSRHCPRSAHITGPSCLALRFAFCLDEWVLSRDSPRALSLDTDSWRDRGMTTRVLLGGLMHAAAVEVHEIAGVCFAQNKLRSIDDDRPHARRAARIPASVSPNLRWDRNAARFAALLAVVRRERFEDDAADQHCREHDQRGRKPPNHDQAAPRAGCQPLAPRRLPDRVCPQPRREERVAEVEGACFCFCTHASLVSRDSNSVGRVEGAEPPSARTRAQRRGREPAGCALATMNSFDYSLVEEQDPSVGAFPGRHSWGPAPSEAAAGPRRAFTLVRVVLTRACLVHSGGPPCHV